MKSVVFLLITIFQFKSPSAEFNGVLKYESDYELGGTAGKVLTTIYESDSKGRVESKNIQTKSDIGTPTTKDQDVILYDFSKLQETHLQTATNRAVVSPYLELLLHQNKSADSTLNAVKLEVQNLGSEKVGEYNCTHFVLKKTNPKLKISIYNPTKNDVWITKDLGSCRVWYVGPYLYYPEGSTTQKKLAEAGMDGVVVKWHNGSGNLQNSGMLISYDKKSLPSSTFTPPSGFTVVQSEMSLYPQKN